MNTTTNHDGQRHGGTAPPESRGHRRGRRRGQYGRGGVRQRDGIFFIRYTAWDPKLKKRRRIEEATDAKNLTEAKQFLDERLGDRAKGLTPAAVSRTRLRELYDDARADYENRKQRTEVLEGRWKHLEAFFGGDELAKRITHPRIQQYIDTRRAEEAAEATIEHEMAALRRMLRLGYKNRKVAQLPVFPTIKGDRVRAVFFEDDEIERLDQTLIEELADGRNVGNDWLPVFVKVVRWTGVRRNELLRLERRSLDLEAGKITLPPGSTKNKEGRVVYLPGEALEALKGWDEKTRALDRERGVQVGHGVRWVFHRKGEPIRTFPYDIWHAACARANLAGKRIPHDFRRTAARSYRRAGVSEGVAMKILGHKTRSIFERYNIKSEDDLREAATLVGAPKQVVGQIGGNMGEKRAPVVLPAKIRCQLTS